MNRLLLIIALLAQPLVSQAAGNRRLHCRSENAELIFHTTLYGSLAAGEYTILRGIRKDLPDEARDSHETPLDFENQGHVFRVENPTANAPLEFTLLAHLFGDDLAILERGSCVEF